MATRFISLKRGPGRLMATVRYQSQTSKVARYCVHRRVDEKEVDRHGCPPGIVPHCQMYKPLVLDPLNIPPTLETEPDAEDKHRITKEERANRDVEVQESAAKTRREVGLHQPMRRGSSSEIPESPPLAIQLPSSSSPFGQNCAPTQPPPFDPGCRDHLSSAQLHDLCRQHGYRRGDAKKVLKTCLASTQDQKASSNTQNLPLFVDTPRTSAAKRGNPPAGALEHLQGPKFAPDKRCEGDALRAVSVANKVIAKEHAQWWNSDLKPRVNASRS